MRLKDISKRENGCNNLGYDVVAAHVPRVLPEVDTLLSYLEGDALTGSDLLAEDEYELAKFIAANCVADPYYSPSMLVADFIRGVNAKLALGQGDLGRPSSPVQIGGKRPSSSA